MSSLRGERVPRHGSRQRIRWRVSEFFVSCIPNSHRAMALLSRQKLGAMREFYRLSAKLTTICRRFHGARRVVSSTSFLYLPTSTSIRVPLVKSAWYSAALLPRVVLLLGLLAGTGCAIGGIEHHAYHTPPGENLVVDVARAVDRIGHRVTIADYEQANAEKPPRRVDPPEVAVVQLAEPVPLGPLQEAPEEERARPHYPEIISPAPSAQPLCPSDHALLAPPAAPPVGPPGRFFPVPTRPVFWP